MKSTGRTNPQPSARWLATRIRISSVLQAWDALTWMRTIRESGMTREMLGRDSALRLELSGIPESLLDEVLPEVRSRADWPRVWERCGDDAATTGTHLTAAASFYLAQKWPFVSDQAKARLYAKAVEQYALVEHEAPLERFSVECRDRTIAGLLQVPETSGSDSRLPVVVLFPGLSATKEEMHPLTTSLLRRGIAVCRVDLPGYGETTGHIDETPEEFGAAVVAHVAADPRIDASRIHTAGFCLGGLCAGGAAVQHDVQSVTLISTPIKPMAYLHRVPREMHEALRVAFGVRTQREVIEASRAMKLIRLPRITCPIQLVYGGQDTMVPPTEMNIVMRYADGPVHPHFFPSEAHSCVGEFETIVELIATRALGIEAEVSDADQLAA